MQLALVWTVLLALSTPRTTPRLNTTTRGRCLGHRQQEGPPSPTRRNPRPPRSLLLLPPPTLWKASTAASNFRLAMGVLLAQGCAQFHKVRVYACLFIFSDASFESLRLINEYSIG